MPHGGCSKIAQHINRGGGAGGHKIAAHSEPRFGTPAIENDCPLSQYYHRKLCDPQGKSMSMLYNVIGTFVIAAKQAVGVTTAPVLV